MTVSTVQRTLSCTAASVPAARRFVAERLVGAPADLVHIATLLVSELVTNSVIHAGTEVTVAVTVGRDEVRVEVTDHGPGTPTLADPLPTNPHGRGLQFVNTLASSWGSAESRTGAKTTWFVLDTGNRGLQFPRRSRRRRVPR